jgi:hypothetical protein
MLAAIEKYKRYIWLARGAGAAADRSQKTGEER